MQPKTNPICDGNHPAVANPNVVYAGQRLRVHEGDLATGLVPVQAAAPRSSSSISGHSAPVKSYTVTPAAGARPGAGRGGQCQPWRLKRSQ